MMLKNTLEASAAQERLELYCMAHSGSPTAVRRPNLFFRSGTWVALLGDSIERGITGFGPTVEDALRAFDRQYLNTLRPPDEKIARRAPGSRTRARHDRSSIPGSRAA
jgi:hypothetical protein